MIIDIWADVVCPWCYLGSARLKQAVERSEEPVEVRVHAFQLDTNAPREVGTAIDYLVRKYGRSAEEAAAGEERLAALAAADHLAYDTNHAISNTADMHRVIQLAQTHGVGWECLEAIQRELFAGNAGVFEHEELVRIAVGVGVRADEVAEVLAGDRYADVVVADQVDAQRLGVTGVPFVVLDGRLGVPGAVSVEQYADLIRQAAS